MQENSTLFFTNLLVDRTENGINTAIDEEPVPSEATIQNILNYSKSLQIKKTKDAGIVAMVLN